MLFGFLFVLVLLLIFVSGLFLLFFEKTRLVGWSFLGGVLGLVGTVVLVDSFQPKRMVKEAPLESELIGTWECTRLSAGFKKKVPLEGQPPRMVISKGGRFTAEKLPMRDPYRYAILNSTWDLNEPDSTPSGCYSVFTGDAWFICYKDKDEVILRQSIDVTYDYEAEYRRIDEGEQPLGTGKK